MCNLGPHAENGRNSCFKWEASHETYNGVHVRRKRLLADLARRGREQGGTWRFIASNVSSSGTSNGREAAIARHGAARRSRDVDTIASY